MGHDWRDCIVTLFDLPGVKKLASQGGAGSSLMRQLHSLAVSEVPTLSGVVHAYVWNDSVLLLSFVDKSIGSYNAAMRDADRFKRRIDKLRKSYAVAVKGGHDPIRWTG
jgi:hypothetical protein